MIHYAGSSFNIDIYIGLRWWPATLHFLVSCMSAMNPSSASLSRIPALMLYKDEVYAQPD
jgi:hypothetical protein